MLFSALNDWMNNDTDSDSLSATHRRQATSPTFLGSVEQMSFEHGLQHLILYLAPQPKDQMRLRVSNIRQNNRHNTGMKGQKLTNKQSR